MYDDLEPIASLKYGEVVEAASRDMQADLSNALASFAARGLARSGAVEAEKLRIRLAAFEKICRSTYQTWLDLITRRSNGKITGEDINFIMTKVESCTQSRLRSIREAKEPGGITTPQWAAEQADVRMHAVTSGIRRELEIKYREQEAFPAKPMTAGRTLPGEGRLDPLLQIPDRGAFNDAFVRLYKSASIDKPLSVIVADIDHFKQVNDTYGHLVGDEVLKEVAQFLTAICGHKGTVYRWGGEEFAILLENYTLAEAAALAERFRSELAEGGRKTDPQTITASFGVAAFSEAIRNEQALFQAADEALQTAKREGRNQIRIAGGVQRPRGTTPITQQSLSVFMRTDEAVRKLDESIASASGQPFQMSHDASFHVFEKTKALDISTIEDVADLVRASSQLIVKVAKCFLHTTPVPAGYSVSFALDIAAARRGLPALQSYFESLKLSNFSAPYAKVFLDTLNLLDAG
jgi:diguanylate cyclase (GGDEF)-like protein